ncbi:TPA: ATP-binding protein, partial [Acinetobacter baumannii]|nr:ATP-binding protein [Acinetobacter baumannii]HAV6043795.1 ATP-binding protein [Acinetobacter baumannii]HAV6107789.1 ATP-binding protein [Acinetobacter baumannii]HAV6123746.1 ATP-binding protein [Acinetobacter baumannii]HAV6143169.1 ATP-binding protein [Acinetobacter baumannii]
RSADAYKIPNTDHSTLAISLGQDSLSSIITALASFKKIKRELGDEYIGGLLVIDEIEAGLHPRAQIKLMDLLKSQAKNLKLQIVLTSHSLTVIKYIFDLKDPNNTSELDSVVYLADTRVPRLFKDPTYTKIKHDMLLVNNEERNYPKEKIIKIYFEDDEAKYFFEKILEHKNLTNGEMAFGANIETISLKVGSEILVKLAPTDNYFKMAVLIADNDVASRSNNRKIIDTHTNFCVLPASKFIKENSPSKDRNPESLIYNFIKNRFDNPKEFKDFWDESDAYSTDYVLDHILTLSDTDRTNRVKMKSWFNSCRSYFDEQKIVQKWCDENMEQVDAFITDLNQAIDEASKNIEMAKVV